MLFASYRTMTPDLLQHCITIVEHSTARIFIGWKILCLINKTKENQDKQANPGHWVVKFGHVFNINLIHIFLFLFGFLLTHVIFSYWNFIL